MCTTFLPSTAFTYTCNVPSQITVPLITAFKLMGSYDRSFGTKEILFTVLICSLFNDTFSVTQDYLASNETEVNDEFERKNLEGSSPGLISGTILAFAWKD
jgi:hypothetical protein